MQPSVSALCPAAFELAITAPDSPSTFLRSASSFHVLRISSFPGKVGSSSPISTPNRIFSISSGTTFPSVTAKYVLSTCFFGESILWASCPSSVIRSKPSVSLSRRPTGKRFRLPSFGTRSRTVFSLVSSVALTYPAGLCKR